MLKKSASCLALVVVFALGAVIAHAQSDDKKFEIGGQFSVLRVPQPIVSVTTLPCIVAPCPFTSVATQNRATNYGFGGRFGYRVSEHFTLEGEGNFFPHDGVLDAGRKIQGFFGVKAGKRFEKIGVFAKARPGFIRYSRGDYREPGGPCIAIFPQPIGCFQAQGRTSFAIDLGGVFEYYPTKRTIIRFDAGDTIVRLPARNVAAFQSNTASFLSLVVVPAPAETRNHFQASAGFGFRF
ncbi:MAG TPA: hypothetical protein VHQ64_00840 [Pyrinomonadaceae bacterium]|nr:hypothetical protein [Pyrinomonadaceae bacterium]